MTVHCRICKQCFPRRPKESNDEPHERLKEHFRLEHPEEWKDFLRLMEENRPLDDDYHFDEE